MRLIPRYKELTEKSQIKEKEKSRNTGSGNVFYQSDLHLIAKKKDITYEGASWSSGLERHFSRLHAAKEVMGLNPSGNLQKYINRVRLKKPTSKITSSNNTFHTSLYSFVGVIQ